MQTHIKRPADLGFVLILATVLASLACMWGVVVVVERLVGGVVTCAVGCALCVGVAFFERPQWRICAVQIFGHLSFGADRAARAGVACLKTMVQLLSILWLATSYSFCVFAESYVRGMDVSRQLQTAKSANGLRSSMVDITHVAYAVGIGDGLNTIGTEEVYYDAIEVQQEARTRVFCPLCRYWVTALGHESRCRVSVDSRESFTTRRRAWLGDVLHKLDVFDALVTSGMDTASAKIRVGRYIDSSVQREYMVKFCNADVNGGEHSIAQVFESNYMNLEFREKYLMSVFGNFHHGDINYHRNVFQGIVNVGEKVGFSDEVRTQLIFVGELIYTYELRLILMARNSDNKGLQTQFAGYTSSSALAKYVKTYGVGRIHARGDSNSSLAKAFKANWYGSYRAAYLLRVLDFDVFKSGGEIVG